MWSTECVTAFDKVKQRMSSDTVLTHFNPKLPLVFSCDASADGLGAVLSHTMPDGGERPVALTEARPEGHRVQGHDPSGDDKSSSH